MTRNVLVVTAVAVALTAGCNRNGGTAGETSRTTGAVGTAGDTDKLTRGDKDFVHDVAMANTAEIQLGIQASARTGNDQVKHFAEMMVDDHTKAGDELMAVASKNGFEWPVELDRKYREKSDDLGKEKGVDFDRDYMAYMVAAHKDLVDKLESRIDTKNLEDWKGKVADPATQKTLREHVEAFGVAAEKSDNPVTMEVNEWAAGIYPIAYAHLEAAKTIDAALKARRTD
jgi:putative membrane protein